MVYVHLIPLKFGMNCQNSDLHMLYIEHTSKLQFSCVSEQIVVVMLILLSLASVPVSHSKSIQKAE
jgi:hypothetical protein